jgi:hypothetical protein
MHVSAWMASFLLKLLRLKSTIMKSFVFIVSIFLFSPFFAIGQDEKKDVSESYNKLVKRYEAMKDSLSKVNPLLPAVSSVMMNKNQLEVNLFNTILSATRARNIYGDLYDLNARSTYLYNTLQFTYGISENARWNLGLDLNLTSARIGDNNSSMFEVFSSNVEGNSQFARAITSMGPRIRWKPFQDNYRVTLQSSILFPALKDEDIKYLLGKNQVYFQSQLLYNFLPNDRFFLFSQLGFQYGFKNEDVSTKFYPALTGYGVYYIPRKTILFSIINYTPFFMNETQWEHFANALQIGGGMQYQISKNILINGYFTKCIWGTNYPHFSSYTIGLRFVTG